MSEFKKRKGVREGFEAVGSSHIMYKKTAFLSQAEDIDPAQQSRIEKASKAYMPPFKTFVDNPN